MSMKILAKIEVQRCVQGLPQASQELLIIKPVKNQRDNKRKSLQSEKLMLFTAHSQRELSCQAI